MADTWIDLVAEVTKIDMTPAEVREQRRSFAYGNTHIENSTVTREMVAKADEKHEQKKAMNEPGS